MLGNGLIICSGGMDSVTLLHEYKDRISDVLYIDYGSKHAHKEKPFAKYHAAELNKTFRSCEIDFARMGITSNLLMEGGEIPNGHYEDAVMKKTVVPFRNGIMLSIAASIAESIGCKELFIANHSGDHAVYPDCREAFIAPMQVAIFQGTYAGIELYSPYLGITKRNIAERGKELGIDYSTTWSCYKGGDVHCGKCGTCVERKMALEGFDPTEYQEAK